MAGKAICIPEWKEKRESRSLRAQGVVVEEAEEEERALRLVGYFEKKGEGTKRTKERKGRGKKSPKVAQQRPGCSEAWWPEANTLGGVAVWSGGKRGTERLLAPSLRASLSI